MMKGYLFSFLLIPLLSLVNGLGEDKLIILESDDPDEGKLLVIAKPHHDCQIILNPAVVEHVTKSVPQLIYTPKNNEDLFGILEKCGFDLKRLRQKYVKEESRLDKRKITIFPGTQWCGDGQDAVDYDDLGTAEETDKCCRGHDHCKNLLFSDQSKGNLTNDSSFTALSCECDDTFQDCLVNADSWVADEVGNLYFNVLRRRCYEFDHPIICTNSWNLLVTTYCSEYGRDTSAPKQQQWRAAREYPKLAWLEIAYGPHVSLYHFIADKVSKK